MEWMFEMRKSRNGIRIRLVYGKTIHAVKFASSLGSIQKEIQKAESKNNDRSLAQAHNTSTHIQQTHKDTCKREEQYDYSRVGALNPSNYSFRTQHKITSHHSHTHFRMIYVNTNATTHRHRKGRLQGRGPPEGPYTPHLVPSRV
jgi:hypothetical protein